MLRASVDEIARGEWEREERRAKNRNEEKVYTPGQEEDEKTKREEEQGRAQDPCTPGRRVSGLGPRTQSTSHHQVPGVCVLGAHCFCLEWCWFF